MPFTDPIEINKKTALCLGYGDGTNEYVIIPVGMNPRPLNRYRGIHNIYLCMDIVKYQIVGDTYTPLLRVILMKSRAYIFSDPHYIPVSSEYTESIAIHLMSDSGEFIPSLLGKTIVKVHFRRRRPEYR